MEKLTIRKYPDPILREKAKKIKDPLNKDVQEIISAMIAMIRGDNKAVGLAAPQVGSSLQLCVIDDEGTTYVLINPKITAKSRTKITAEEGCLSFPGQFFPIARSSEVQVRYLDEFGEAKKVKGQGLLARALQHEIDHLEGILFIDKMKKVAAKKTVTKK